jgi:hypothetical protein
MYAGSGDGGVAVCVCLLLTNYLSEYPLCSPDHIARVASSSARTLPRSLYSCTSRQAPGLRLSFPPSPAPHASSTPPRRAVPVKPTDPAAPACAKTLQKFSQAAYYAMGALSDRPGWGGDVG